MSVERRGAQWRVRWREAGQHRSRTFPTRREAVAFDHERARASRGAYSTSSGQPCIPLGHGRVALVDAVDVDPLATFSWRVNGKGYVVRSLARDTTEAMHRQVIGLAPDDPRMVDHKNGDTLDNRRDNLRVATALDNQHNREAVRVEQLPSGTFRGRCRVAGVTIRTPTMGTHDKAKAAIEALRREAQDRAGIVRAEDC